MSSSKRRLLQLLVAVVFLLCGVWGMVALRASKPPKESRVPDAPAPVVQVVRAEPQRQPIVIQGQGTVRPLRETHLVPQVSGKVLFTSDRLLAGGLFNAGDDLLRIDPVDYELAVTLARARVQDAEADYVLALQESEAAVQEWRDLNPGMEPPDLVARKPQLSAAKANLDAERADLRKARLQLDRTRLRAPFDGVVSEKQVDIGQYVTPGQVLATLYGTRAAEIVVPLPSRSLRWIDVPGFTSGDSEGSPGVVRAALAGAMRTWKAQVVRAEGRIDEKTRMINVVVRVDQPYAQRPPLAAGLFADVEIKGRTLDNAALLPRAALRPNAQMWVVDSDDRLYTRTVRVAHLTTDGVIVDQGLAAGDRVVISQLKAVAEGMVVRPVARKKEGQS
jgi:RND family efflux transporter MFP subunit